MKKLLLTISAVALIGIAGIAQQDTTQSNQYRPITRPQPTHPIDSLTEDMNEDARERGQNIRRGTDTTGYDMQQPTDSLNQDMEGTDDGSSGSIDDQSQNNTDQGMEQGEEGANVMTQQSAQEPAQNQSPSRENVAADGSASSQPASTQPGADVEVENSKEGPNNEVVYKINGELYYVDREKKELVKADKSELKDNKHDVEVHEGTATKDTDKNRKRTKG